MSRPREDHALHRQRVRRRIGEFEKVVGVVAVERGIGSFGALGRGVLGSCKATADDERRGNCHSGRRIDLGNRTGHPHFSLGRIAGERRLRQGKGIEGVRPVGTVLSPLCPFTDVDDIRAAAVAVVGRQGAGDGGGFFEHEFGLARRVHGYADIDGGAGLIEVDAVQRHRVAGLDRGLDHGLDSRAAVCLGQLDLDIGVVQAGAAKRRGDGRHGVGGEGDGDVAVAERGCAELRGRRLGGVAVIAEVAQSAVGRRFVRVWCGRLGAIDRPRVSGAEPALVEVKGENRGDVGRGIRAVDRGLGIRQRRAEKRIAVHHVFAESEVIGFDGGDVVFAFAGHERIVDVGTALGQHHQVAAVVGGVRRVGDMVAVEDAVAYVGRAHRHRKPGAGSGRLGVVVGEGAANHFHPVHRRGHSQ